ncbi:L-lactate dehydrogenase [Hyphomonas sp. WL0036]|uniref:L-lactate dehydrogenase n=1 Tax=Hyphomonas sediminis TaxID=2866160 RepID=UPI001C8008A1|nr:L-lactate dehydrogenase [Hyphomonas sediminis]MBY9067956.1 L-lactate dehydrogenase [Hyphomonas sediminis]
MPTLSLAPASASDYRLLAEKRLPRFLFDYLDGGAYAELTLRRNIADLEALELRQRILRDVSSLSTRKDFLGSSLTMPLALSPVGLSGMMARRGEARAAKVAGKFGIPYCLSTLSICSVEEVGAATEGPFWFQLYMIRDRGAVADLIARAKAAGATALLLTVDLPVVGTRYRDVRNTMSGGGGAWANLRRGLISYMLHPQWAVDVGMNGGPHIFGNVAPYVANASTPADFAAWANSSIDPSVSWADIQWIRSKWDGPLIIKGILDHEDAIEAVNRGADGIVVSNHGGRQLDGVSSSLRALPPIADAVSGKTLIILDGGIRSGQDVLKALASGADLTMMGRPWVYALAGAGEKGLSDLLSAMKGELSVSMALTGITSVTDASPNLLFRSPLQA